MLCLVVAVFVAAAYGRPGTKENLTDLLVKVAIYQGQTTRLYKSWTPGFQHGMLEAVSSSLE